MPPVPPVPTSMVYLSISIIIQGVSISKRVNWLKIALYHHSVMTISLDDLMNKKQMANNGLILENISEIVDLSWSW